MINFRDIRGFLVAGLVRAGFSEREDKSCRAYRVFSDGSTTLLVQPNESGVYDYYTNPDDSEDFGDITQFVLRRRLGIRAHGELRLSKQDYFRLQKELELIGAFSDSVPSFKAGAARVKKKFRHEDHDIIFLEQSADANNETAFRSVTSFLRKRGISTDLTDPGLTTTIAALRTSAGYHNALFIWRYADGGIAGAQYKFLTSGREVAGSHGTLQIDASTKERHRADSSAGEQPRPKSIKRFLPHSDREHSLWFTSLEGKAALMVCEDPLDALAHRQLYPALDYGYACSGGTLTNGQISLIHELAGRHGLSVVPGNDNDTAGRIANLRIMLPKARIRYDKAAGVVEIAAGEREDNNESGTSCSETEGKSCGLAAIPVNRLADYMGEVASRVGITLAMPPHPAKDWNEMVMTSGNI